MIILIGLTVILVACILLSRMANKRWWGSDWEDIFFHVGVIAGMLLILALVFWPITYYVTKAEVNRYYALQETVEYSREYDEDSLERATIVRDIIDYNKDLAEVKYWNDTIFDIYIYDGLAELVRRSM